MKPIVHVKVGEAEIRSKSHREIAIFIMPVVRNRNNRALLIGRVNIADVQQSHERSGNRQFPSVCFSTHALALKLV